MYASMGRKGRDGVISIKLGYNIALGLSAPTAVIYVLHVHPSRTSDLVTPETFRIEPSLRVEEYFDGYGNHCGRVNAPAGVIRFLNDTIIRDSGEPDPSVPNASQPDVTLLPLDTLHQHIRFDYMQARANRTALEAFRERVGVCRDFTHLAITLCRCLNLPARYVTGYLGDIGVPPSPGPMDFSAWFEVFLGQRWYTFDARHNARRIGRVVIGRGRDAGDVPITMAFGKHSLEHFEVTTEQVEGAI